MSNNILPSFPGITWGIQKKPLWNTNVSDAISGRQFALRRRLYPVWRFKLPYELLRTQASLTELQQMVGFFNSRNGRYDDWLYLDPRENAASAQQIGIGNGAQTVFPIVKTYGGFTEPVGAVDPATLQVFRNDWQGNQLMYPTIRTNWLAYSEEFDNAAWTKNTCTVTANTIVAPDGTTTADVLTATGADSSVSQNISTDIATGVVWVYSVWLKAPSPMSLVLAGISFPSTTGTTTVCNVTTVWQRFSLTSTIPLGDTSISLFVGAGNTFTTGEVVHAWGAQAELHRSTPTSYIKTTSPVVTVIDYALNNASPGSLRTNYLLRSAAFGNAIWTKGTCTVTANTIYAPDGTLTADVLTGTGADSYAMQPVAVAAGTKVVFSVWLKAPIATNISLILNETGGVTTNTSLAASVTTTWQRFQVSATVVPGTTTIATYIGGFATFTSGEIIHAWGAQLEFGTLVASDYIATADAAVSVTNPDSASYRDTVIFAVAPVNGATITWTGTYYYRCRFTNEDLPLEEFMSGKWKSDLEFRSFRP